MRLDFTRPGPMPRLILLDRDGVINFDSPSYIRSPAEWRPIPGSLEAIAALTRAGRRVAVCTNQSGIGRGLLSVSCLDAIHALLHDALAALGSRLDQLLYCPHLPEDGCGCRKPAPGMLLECMNAVAAVPEQTCFVGDSLRDLQAARAAGCKGVLVRTGNGARLEAERQIQGATVFDDLAGFARIELGAVSA